MALCALSFSNPLSSLFSLRRPLSIPSTSGTDHLFHLTPSLQRFACCIVRARELREDFCIHEEPALLSTLAPEKPVSRKGYGSSQDDILGSLDCAIALRHRDVGSIGHPCLSVVPEVETHETNPVRITDGSEVAGELSIHRPTMPRAHIVEPEFRTSFSKLMDESGAVPVWVYGDMEVSITGIQNDSRKVTPGDLYVCCIGLKTDGHVYIGEAVNRGAVAVVASRKIDMDGIPAFRAFVVVKDTNSVLPALAATFYKNPSKSMSVIGITGTNGKTTTAHLVRAIHESMVLRTGMLGTVGYYFHGGNQLEAPNTTPDAIMVQKLMAEMVHKGTEVLVMEASSHALSQGRCDEIDFNIAIFTNLTRDHYDFHGTEEEYRNSKAKLFARMVDPKCHRKIVNIDDPNAPFFLAQGNPDVPTMTFAMENRDADVYPLNFELSLTRTQVLIRTPKGRLEISSGLLGRHNVDNILAAVAVGIVVGASLEDIVRGIEGLDGVPGRCELIDEKQPFGVIVDFAHSPDALSRLLDTVREIGARRVITVVGCAGESDRGKRPMMTKIATEKSDVVILTSDNPKSENPFDILDDMMAGIGWTMQDYVRHGKHGYYPTLPNGHRIFVHDNRRVAVRAAVAMAEKGDIVIVAGRGHETYQLEGDEKKYIDDREECREALQYIGNLHRAGMDKRMLMLVVGDLLMSFFKDVEPCYT